MSSPREKFRKSPHAKGWNDLVDSSQFDAAATASMLHLTQNVLQKPDNTESAAANEYRRQGAVTFLEILVNLNTENEPNKPTVSRFNPRA